MVDRNVGRRGRLRYTYAELLCERCPEQENQCPYDKRTHDRTGRKEISDATYIPVNMDVCTPYITSPVESMSRWFSMVLARIYICIGSSFCMYRFGYLAFWLSPEAAQ